VNSPLRSFHSTAVWKDDVPTTPSHFHDAHNVGTTTTTSSRMSGCRLRTSCRSQSSLKRGSSGSRRTVSPMASTSAAGPATGFVELVGVFFSIHDARFSQCAGAGKVLRLAVPYCPKCESRPEETSCIHDYAIIKAPQTAMWN
jgi:hypothetical protein